MIKSKEDLNNYLQKDSKYAGIHIKSKSLTSTIIWWLKPNYSYRYIKILRVHNYYSNKKGLVYSLISKCFEIRLHLLGTKLGFYIPKDVFGPGLYLPHTGSICVNPNAKIGANCQINNNVVIGHINGKAPIIGDNVYIGPGAVVSGDIVVADNVWIGANAVLTKSIDMKNAFVAGVPAKIVSIKKSNWVEDFNFN